MGEVGEREQGPFFSTYVQENGAGVAFGGRRRRGEENGMVKPPTARAVRDYLVGKQVAPKRAQAVAVATELPLSVTKRGALLFARKSR